jgi:hypothetical protein
MELGRSTYEMVKSADGFWEPQIDVPQDAPDNTSL